MNMKILILGFCLLLLLINSGCHKEQVSLEELSQRVEEGIWNFNRGYADFTLKKIVFEDSQMTLSYDNDLDGQLDYHWPHKYYISRDFHNTYLHLQPIGFPVRIKSTLIVWKNLKSYITNY